MTERREPSTSISALLSELAEAPDRAPEELLPELRPGDLVAGRFELVRELGRGGFGLVFEARDRELGRLVAFKAIRPARTRALERLAKPLREEAEAAARLNHPNVVTLHDSGVHDGTPYLIMELLRGETLAARLRQGPLPPAEALGVALEVAAGLVHAHAAGVLHRDLKPGNVFLTDRGSAKLVDFGLASIMGRASLAAGTPAYMAPEQLRGQPEDARTDVFSAAVVLFESLTGTLPYPVVEGRSAVLDAGPPPRLALAEAPLELVALLTSALARDPASRPQGAQAWLDGLLVAQRATQALETARARAVRRRRLRRVIWTVGAAAVVVAGLVAGASVRARAAAERALRESRLLAAAEGASDPLLSTLLLAELSDDPPARAVEVAQRVLGEPVPSAALEGAKLGSTLAVSPDGQRVAVGQRDGTVTVFRTDGRGAPEAVQHETLRNDDLVYAGDGARLLSAGHDGALHLYPAEGRGAPVAIPLGSSPLTRVRLSPDGRLAAAAALDGRVHVVDLVTLRPIGVSVRDAAVLDLAFTRDGAALITVDAAGQVALADPRTAAPLLTVSVGAAAVALAVSADGRTIAVGGADGVIHRLDRTLRPAARPTSPGPQVSTLAFAPEGDRLAAGLADGTLRLELAGGRGEAPRLRGHREPVQVAWAPDGDRLLTWSVDGQVLLWSAAGEPDPVPLRGPSMTVAAFTPDGARIVGRTRDGALRIWPTAPGARDLLVGHKAGVDTVVWSHDGARLLTSAHDGTARIWDRATATEQLLIRDPGGIIHSAAWDPAEQLVLTASEDGVARIWRAQDGRLVGSLPPAGSPILFAAWSPDGTRVATAGLDGVVRVHPADGSAPPALLKGHEAGITHVTFTPDGRGVVSASQLDATVRVWSLEGGRPAGVVRADHGVFRAGLSPGGDRLAVAEVDGPLRLFQLPGLSELPPVRAWPERLWASAWSPDGRRLALASTDGSVRVMPLQGEGEPLVLRGHQGPVNDAAFRPDGRELATASADGTIRIAAVDWPLLRQRLAATTSACLGAAQRIHLLGETEEEARQRHDECERRHGREPPTTAPPGAPPRRAGLDRSSPAGRGS